MPDAMKQFAYLWDMDYEMLLQQLEGVQPLQ